MKISPATRVCVLGAVLYVALTVCSANLRDRGGTSFIASLSVAGIAYLFAIGELFSVPRLPRRVVAAGLALAFLWHLEFLLTPPGRDDDIHRYVWDGRLQRLGYNPYVVVPSDPAVRSLHTAETRDLNNPDLPSPYPAGAQLLFRAITGIHESTFALKVTFLMCDFAIALMLLDLLRRSGKGAHLVLAYAWSPLLAVEAVGSGHIDVVGALLLLVSFAALQLRHRTLAAVTCGLAIAVKLLPVVLLPLYWKRVRMRDAVLAAVVVAALYLPFLNEGWFPIGSLRTYILTFRFNDPVFALFERMAPQIAAGLPVVIGFLSATWLRRAGPVRRNVPDSTAPEWSADRFVWPMAASLLCAPVVYPWYLLWLLPFLNSAATWPIAVWTVSIIPIYIVWHLRTLGHAWLLPGWVVALEYGVVAIAGGITLFRRFGSGRSLAAYGIKAG